MAHYTQLADTKIGGYVLTEFFFEEADLIVTYKAHQPTLNRYVAIQILNPVKGKAEIYQKGFMRSAEIMANLEHPHIAPVHEVGKQDDLLYIVTRLMNGKSLRFRIKNEKFSLPDIASMVRQIAGALDYAHAKGQVHGDPSVANIAFDEGSNAYIVDFHVSGFKTATDQWIGTPAFAAPELLFGKTPNPLTDQYALGSIAYLLMSQQSTSSPELQSYKLRRDRDLPEVQSYNPQVPLAVNDVMKRVLAHDPQDRYPTVMDFSREFEKALLSESRNLFISYSRRDTEYAQQLKNHLKSNGFDVWMDDAIEHGEQWFNEIHEAIQNCVAFLVIMTPESEKSEWVHKEVLLAKRYQKPIFPLLLKEREFAILIDVQYADVRNNEMPQATFYRRLRQVVFGQV